MKNHTHADTATVSQTARGAHIHGLNPALAVFQQTGSGAQLGMSGGPAAGSSGYYVPTAEPDHTHNVGVTINPVGPNDNTTDASTGSTADANGTTAAVTNANLQPYLIVNHIIRIG
jgi:hypothetical protein